MRQFVPNGPVLPYEVLQAHEEGRLVFFCGAGVSFYTGLPDFKNLVLEVFDALSFPLHKNGESETDLAFRNNDYDRALHLLEMQVSQRAVVREKVIEILSKKPKRGSGTVRLHEALLDLAFMHDNKHRIVTTNFDDRFHIAGKGKIPFAEAPRLGWPRIENWRHLTYLHGRISKSDPKGEDLILTSGDFGRAYLTEGWASDFLVELFRHYTVLFVGYSLRDPVLRYIVDAIATEISNGQFLRPYVLDGYEPGQRESMEKNWKAKSVTPILFSLESKGDAFSNLHKTLKLWAKSHRGGLTSRIAEARTITMGSYAPSLGDDVAKNFVWALSKPDGSVAKTFAEFDPPPDISWLVPLSKHKIPIGETAEEVSLLALPSPPGQTSETPPNDKHHLAPLAGRGAACISDLPIDPVTRHLGRWLAHHREKKELVDWVTAHQGITHPSWNDFLSDDLHNLSEPWRTYWRIVTMGYTIPPCNSMERLLNLTLSQDSWPHPNRDVLLAATQAWVTPSKPINFWNNSEEPASLSDIADFKLCVTNDHLIKQILGREKEEEIRSNLAEIADCLTSSLKNLLMLAKKAEIGEAEEYSYLRIPAVADQPREISEKWGAVFRITRVAFDCLLERNAEAAENLATRWKEIYRGEGLILFARLYVYATTENDSSSFEEAVGFLLENGGKIIWDHAIRPEVHRFLRIRFGHIRKSDQNRLIKAVKNGPERSVFPEYGGSDSEFSEIAERWRRNHVIKIAQSSAKLPPVIQRLAEKYGKEGASEEIEKERHSEPVGGWVEYAKADDLLEESPEKIAADLLQTPEEKRVDFLYRREPGRLFADLIEKSTDKGLSVARILSEEECNDDIWVYGLGGLQKVPLEKCKDVFQTLIGISRTHPEWLNKKSVQHPLSNYLRDAAGNLDFYPEDDFMAMWDMLWDAVKNTPDDRKDESPQKLLTSAINAPGGALAEAFLGHFFAHQPKVGAGIQNKFLSRINEMWNSETGANRYARVILASRLLSLHCIDPQWARKHIIREIETSDERLNLLSAFLWPARWDIELIRDLESGLNKCFPGISQSVGEIEELFSKWIGSILVQTPDSLSGATKHAFFQHATARQLENLAWVFRMSLRDSNKGAANLWHDRIEPVFKEFWPGDRSKLNTRVSSRLLSLALASRDAFPAAVNVMSKKGLIVSGATEYVFWDLREAGEDVYDVAQQHPLELLDTLEKTVSKAESGYRLRDLKKILGRIAQTAPNLKDDGRFKRLSEITARG